MRILPLITFLMVIPSLALSLASCGEPEWPEGLPHGEAILPNIDDPDTPGAYFDFSEGEIVYGEEGRIRGDVYVQTTFVCGNALLNVAIHDAQPDSLLYDTSAPGWGRLWEEPHGEDSPGRIAIYQGHNIWVRTAEGYTAKFRIQMAEANADYTSFLRIKIEWIYQPDGSTELHAIPGAEEDTEAEAT